MSHHLHYTPLVPAYFRGAVGPLFGSPAPQLPLVPPILCPTSCWGTTPLPHLSSLRYLPKVFKAHLKNLASTQGIHIRGHKEKDPLLKETRTGRLSTRASNSVATPRPPGRILIIPYYPFPSDRVWTRIVKWESPDCGPARRIPCGNRTRT